jgi:hypothetical protein
MKYENRIVYEAKYGEKDGQITSVEFNGPTASETVSQFKNLMVAVGFHPKSVDDAFINAEPYDDKEE